MGKDTASGCLKCKTKERTSSYGGGYARVLAPPADEGPPGGSDDDIPF